MSTRVRSFCKINLGLAVGPPREDGFHALTTLYQTLGLHDVVTVSAKRGDATQIRLTANHKWVPCSATGNAEKNTAHRMIVGALRRLGIAAEVEIDIDKRLPVQGGLGAGSANAVAALLGLERELRAALPGPERLELAEEIGSDVPLFLLGGTVLGLDRGQQVFAVPDFDSVPCVVAVPSVGVSTAQAFRDLDARGQSGPQGLKPLFASDHDGRAEARPFQNLVGQSLGRQSSVRPSDIARSSVGPNLAAQSIVGPSGIARSSVGRGDAEQDSTGQGNGLQESVGQRGADEDNFSRTGAEGLTERTSPALTFAQATDRLEQLSRVYAGVFTTSGVEPGALRVSSGSLEGTTGITGRTSGLAGNPLLTLVRTGIENDFEEVAFSQHPSLRSIKRDLAGEGPSSALYASLSGSGSALFGLYRSESDAVAAQQRVQSNGTQALLTKTLARPEYWARMFAE